MADPPAMKRAAAYIAKHGGHCLTQAQMRDPEWLAIVAELDHLRATWTWEDGGRVGQPPAPPARPGEQIDLFA
jgi:hypothetical protein